MSIMSDKEKTGSQTWDSEVVYTGWVKWFNNRAGYGFLTVMDSDKKGEDIFVHHSGVKVSAEQYKYLVQGEYVSFSLRESDNDSHPYQAGNITGVCEGKLMCETRWEQRQAREQNEGGAEGQERAPKERSYRRDNQRSRPRGGGPRDEEGATWMLVRTEGGRGGRSPRRRSGASNRHERD